ncbi:MAG TPA: hypothetical protein VLU54_08500 [Casimicrobiaceae bacterium]|nr:hypothetical protein [Casimicrobiaceae bacterium]
MPRVSGQLTNIASELYVASQLTRKGYAVTITFGKAKEIDLIVPHPDGHMVTIDVKGLKNTTNWPLKLKRRLRNHFFILVSYRNHFDDLTAVPDVFVIPSGRVAKLLTPWIGRSDVTGIAYGKVKDSRSRIIGIFCSSARTGNVDAACPPCDPHPSRPLRRSDGGNAAARSHPKL